jgi:RNA polymerase sigma-70 factor (sigma-E family)
MASDRRPAEAPTADGAFEQFVAGSSPRLLRSAYLLTGDRGHAEDLVQNALWRTLNHWHEIDISPEAYGLKVLVNLSRDRKRNLGRRLREITADHVPDPAAPDDLERLLERDAVIAAARELPRRQREVLTLRFLLDLSVAETADTLGFSEGAVKAYTSRALAGMRELLTNEPAPARAPKEVPSAD